MSSGNSGKLVIVGAFLVIAVVVGVFALSRGGDKDASTSGPAGTATPKGTEPTPAADVVTIDFLYSTEKQAWVEESLVDFQKTNPGIKVNAKGKGSLGAVRDILDGKEKPTVWSPADMVAVNILADDWFQKQRKKLFADSGASAPQPLVLTPLVFVAWQDRGEALTDKGTTPLTWKRLDQVLTAKEGWKAIGGSPEWGLIRLGHTDPTQSNSGLQALILMAYEYHDKTSGLVVGDAVDNGFQEFVERVEKAVPKFGKSTGTFMNDMILYGPSKYDMVVTYENLAIEQLPNAQGRWGNLKIYYPLHTMWSSHPAAVLQADWVSPEKKAAGQKLIDFLRAKEAQERALRYGFRPSDPSVPIISNDAQNPFTTAQAFGIQTDVPPAVEPPPGPVISNLMEMWSRRIGR